MLNIVFVEVLRGCQRQNLVKVAILRNVSSCDAHLGILVEYVSPDILHSPIACLSLACFPFQPEIVKFC